MKTPTPPFLHLLVVFLVSACAGTGPEGEADHSGLPLTEDASLATLHPALRGTMSRSYLGQVSTMPFVDHQLVDLWWSELEASGTGTTSGGYFAAGTRDWKKLETALASGIKVRLRIHAGRHAPQYVKRMGFEGGYSSMAASTSSTPTTTSPPASPGSGGRRCSRVTRRCSKR